MSREANSPEPVISAIMAVYKEDCKWISIAIDSILQQTYKNLQLIVVVDNPAHADAIALLKTYEQQDTRFKFLINEKNIGLPLSLNRGIENADGDYVARMDADDISHPERFAKQIDFLLNHSDVSVVGSAIENIDQNGDTIGIKQFLTNPTAIRKAIGFRSVACHPTWLMRKSVWQQIGGYRYFPSGEDYDFLYRVVDSGLRISNLAQPLVQYRIHENSMTSALSTFHYNVKHYVQALHKQRKETGTDDYSESYSRSLKTTDVDERSFAKSLVTKARAAEERKNYVLLAFWGTLAVMFSGAGWSRIKSFIGFNYIKWRYER